MHITYILLVLLVGKVSPKLRAYTRKTSWRVLQYWTLYTTGIYGCHIFLYIDLKRQEMMGKVPMHSNNKQVFLTNDREDLILTM